MNTKQIAAIIVVVIVVAAAAAVALSLGGGNDKSTPSSADVESGAVYGNINGDGRIDDTDIDTIQRIIDGELDASEFPLADADLSGSVDEADLEIVRAAASGSSTTLYVVNVDGDPVAVQYPVTDLAFTSGTNMKSVIGVLGIADRISAIAIDTETMSPVLDKGLYDGIQSGDVRTLTNDSQSLTTESLNILVDLGVRLVIGEDSGMSSGSEIVGAMGGLGITYLQLNVQDLDLQLNAARAIGILLGCEDAAESYCSWTEGIIDLIEESEGDLRGTATVLSVVMSNSVSGTSSNYYAMTEAAGGNNIADWESSTQKFNQGDTWLLDSKYNADYIFHFRTLTYPDGLTDEQIATYAGYFEDTYTYQNGGYYLINGSLPLPVRLAVMAETMYPDCFEDGWSQSVFQEYVTEFIGSDYDVSQSEYIWNA